MITLTLLHPIQSIPVQSWTFEQESVIRIGRSTDNHVILYSAVVSRHHVELRWVDSNWEIVNLGANGTYLDGKRITQVPVVDGVIIRLARSGPNIQIHIGSSGLQRADSFTGEKTIGQRAKSTIVERSPNEAAEAAVGSHPNPEDDIPSQPLAEEPYIPQGTALDREEGNGLSSVAPAEVNGATGPSLATCSHPRATRDSLFCPDCGHPIHPLQTIGAYQVIKPLAEDETSVTQLVWCQGKTLAMKTIAPPLMNHPKALGLFEQRAQELLPLKHPGLPHFVDFFVDAGCPYLVYERLFGQDLKQRVVSQGPFSAPAAIALVLQICDILAYLHQQTPAILHLDLKPSNLIHRPAAPDHCNIAIDGWLALTKLDPEPPTPTGYVAPEPWEQAVPATDLFALGPLLLYLLTGESPRSFYAQREQGFRLYPEYVPGLPPDLVAVIRRLTNPQPEERYTSAAELTVALRQVSACAEKL